MANYSRSESPRYEELDYWDECEYYEEEIIDDDPCPNGLWDVGAIEEIAADIDTFYSSQHGHPFDEASVHSGYSREEEKSEIVPIRGRDPPESNPHQLQPIEQTNQRWSSATQSRDPTATVQRPRLLPTEQPSSVPRASILPFDSDSIEQPSSIFSRNEALASIPSVVDLEDDHVFVQSRIVGYDGTSLVPYNGNHGHGQTRVRKRHSPLLVCALLLVFVVLVLALVLAMLYILAFSESEFFVGDDGSAVPTVSPTTSYGPIVICSGKVTTLTEETVANYETVVDSVVPALYSTWDHAIDSCHPANQALLWMSADPTEREPTDSLQRYIMAFAYFATEGAEWRSQDKWLSQDVVCGWEGIGCTSEGDLLWLNLIGNRLKGPLISEIGYLTKLQVLNLKSNALTGPLPPEMVEGLVDLKILDISQNKLISTIPSQIGILASSMELLSLSGNVLSGLIVSELGQARSLKKLDLGQNNFRGQIPTELNLLSKLRFLNLDNNVQITGRIPTEYGRFMDLFFLSISNTAIRGRLPRYYGALTNIEELHMANTMVGGDIPPTIANMTSLRHMDLSGSRFRKSIPSILGTLGKLTHLSIANNSLTGPIPTEVGLLSSVSLLALEDNLLTGTVPSECGVMSMLEKLTLHHNFLTGRIADDLCSLRESDLAIFTIPCPTRTEQGEHLGITCAVPTCCSACIGSYESSDFL